MVRSAQLQSEKFKSVTPLHTTREEKGKRAQGREGGRRGRRNEALAKDVDQCRVFFHMVSRQRRELL